MALHLDLKEVPQAFGDVLSSNNSGVYRCLDAHNFSKCYMSRRKDSPLQTSRSGDPTTSTIALQLSDTGGIALK